MFKRIINWLFGYNVVINLPRGCGTYIVTAYLGEDCHIRARKGKQQFILLSDGKVIGFKGATWKRYVK